MRRAAILMYHAVDAPRAPQEARFCVQPREFARQMAYLRANGRPLVGVADIAAAVRGEAGLPDDAVAVSFDDGFECFLRNALPVLERHAVPATLFALGGELAANDWMRGEGWPQRKLLSDEQLREAARRGVTVGCHSLTHRRLPGLSAEELAAEIGGGRARLAERLGAHVSLFAYPYGQYGARERDAVVAAGYSAACSTESGFNGPGVDVYALRRIDVYGSDGLRAFIRKLQLGANRVSTADMLAYYRRRLGGLLRRGAGGERR